MTSKGIAARPRKKISAATQALLDEMREDASRPPSESKLSEVRDKIRELQSIDMQIDDLESRLSHLKERRRVVTDKELVDVMDEAGMTATELAPEGNLPGVSVKIIDYCHANIASDWDQKRRDRAFAWLNKYHPGLLGSNFSIKFRKNTRKLQVEFEKLAKKHKLEFKNEFGVPWNTLTAFVKDQIEEKRRPPLDLLGATVGRVAKIKKQKEK